MSGTVSKAQKYMYKCPEQCKKLLLSNLVILGYTEHSVDSLDQVNHRYNESSERLMEHVQRAIVTNNK